VFNRIVGEAGADRLELAFAAFLDGAPDVQAFGKNYMAVGFKVDYVKANGDLSTYTPDFIVRTTDGRVWIVETKGREELDMPQKMARLKQWCADATAPARSRTARPTASCTSIRKASRSTRPRPSPGWWPPSMNTKEIDRGETARL
jgi:hypothetical protein